MGLFEFIISLVSIVLGCVTLWLLLFYARRDKRRRVPESDARFDLAQLSSMAESLQDRIDTLEAILDAEIPDWRDQNEQPAKQSSN
ncbi:MAG: envelope stress response membrane protein PspB [Gammaproteobacteria bacterium]|nr:envelope stress response membrane protein PspB [Pseudomonadales bacterium]MCP5346586.1 envelope stress response membrane protein PspB [Pseudomonadales bacterium]